MITYDRLSREFGAPKLTYRFDYERNTRAYRVSDTNATGTKTETRYNELSQITRRDINGQTVFKAVYKLSDGSEDTQLLANRFRLPNGASTTTGFGTQQDSDTPALYVKTATETDSAGNVTTKTFNRAGEIIKIHYADGSSWHGVYDGNNQLVEETDELGIKTRRTWDTATPILLTSITEAVGTADETKTDYDYYAATDTDCAHGQNPNALKQSATVTLTTEYQYDCRGNISEIRQKAAAENGTDIVESRTNYNGHGQAGFKTDGNGKTWRYRYDEFGNLLTEYAESLQRGWEYSYDAAGNIATAKRFYSENDTRHFGTAYQYSSNAQGQITSTTDSLGNVSRIEYDGEGRMTGRIDANQHGKYWEYNKDGRLVASYDTAEVPNIQKITYQQGLPKMIARLQGTQLLSSDEMAYNHRKQITQTISSAADVPAQIRTRNLDALGNVLDSIDAEGKNTHYSYDSRNRIKTFTDAQNGITELTYNAQGAITQVKDPEGRLTTYQYDKLGHVIEERTADAETARHYRYDNNGNRTHYINAKGECTQYAYNAANELLTVTVYKQSCDSNATPERTINYHYDNFGRYTGYNDGITKVVYSYEQNNGKNTDSVVKVATTFLTMTDTNSDPAIDTRTKTIQYRYNPNGQTASYTNPEGKTYRYSYDMAGRLTAISLGQDGEISFDDYQWDKAKKYTFPGGKIDLTLDGMLRWQAMGLAIDSQTTKATEQNYSYNNENHITTIASNNGNTNYSYDDNFCLIQAKREGSAASTENFAYDNVGNRTQYEIGVTPPLEITKSTYNSANQLTAANDTIYTTDANGHTTKKQTGTNTETYTYNAQERLQSV